MKGICILGATGSIGVSTLDVVARHPDQYKVIALTANTNVDALYEQCLAHHPEYAVVVDEAKAEIFKDKIKQSTVSDINVMAGAEALEFVSTLDNVDSVMAAIVGAAGLLPSLAAAKAGKTVLLANKEALVMSGDIFMQAVHDSGAKLLPIDSEHNAIFQCMPAGYTAGEVAKQARRILLTALELIEACLLFNMSPDDIQVVIHKQSIIHSMVDYVDGSVLAQMGNPDMRVPIAHAMAWPERFESGVEPLNIFDVRQMDFEPPSLERFPCLRLAYEAIKAGGIMPTVLNAANEIAVDEFLNERVKFTDIPVIIEKTMSKFSADTADSLEIILQIDKQAREQAHKIIEDMG
jgi:1-deoxy-D-xylulose-5-phosphate reductoisomerase